MSKFFTEYFKAHKAAIQLAKLIKRDVGLGKSCGGYTIFSLPNSENRYGHELRCEVVTPD